MKVYVVYDPLLEKIISVHKSEKEAQKRADEKDKEDENAHKERGCACLHEYDEFELEE